MDRLRALNSVAFALRDTSPGSGGGAPQYATNGNPNTQLPATVVPGYFLNMVQDELIAPLDAVGIVHDDTSWNQLLAAIQALSGAQTTTLSASATLLPRQGGLIEVNAATGNLTLTLPTPSVGIEYTFYRSDQAASTAAVQAPSGSVILPGSVGTINLTPGWPVRLKFDGTNWVGADRTVGPFATQASLGNYLTINAFNTAIGAYLTSAAAAATYHTIAAFNAAIGAYAKLSSWSISFSGPNNGYTINPAGYVDQTISAAVGVSGAGLQSTTLTLPVTVVSGIDDATICFGGNTPPVGVALSVQPQGKSQVVVTTNSTTVSGNVNVVVRARGA